MNHPPNAPSRQSRSATSRPPLRLRGWPLWGWLVLLFAGFATLAYQASVLPWLAFGVSAEHPSQKDIAAVQDASRDLTLTLLAPWTLTSTLLRPHVRVAVTGVVCTAPAIWFSWEIWRTH